MQSAAAAPPLSTATVRLNLDAAELDDEPEALTPIAHLLNLACGAHAGDVTLATRALRRARACIASPWAPTPPTPTAKASADARWTSRRTRSRRRSARSSPGCETSRTTRASGSPT